MGDRQDPLRADRPVLPTATALVACYEQLVTAYREEHGHDPPAAIAHALRRPATLATRQGKKQPRSLAAMRADWPTTPAPTASSTSSAPWSGTVPDHLPFWSRGLGPSVAPSHSICIEAPVLVQEPVELRRRRDGESMFVEHGAARYTSRTILDAEHRRLTAARTIPTRPDGSLAPPSPEAVNAAVREFEDANGTALDKGQQELVAAFLTDPRLLVVGLGPQGPARPPRCAPTTTPSPPSHTTSVAGGRACCRWRPPPHRPPSPPASSGYRRRTLHKFLHEHLHGSHAQALGDRRQVPAPHEVFQLRPRDLVLVDEAGMAGTLNLDRLFTIATAHGATIRLLGTTGSWRRWSPAAPSA